MGSEPAPFRSLLVLGMGLIGGSFAGLVRQCYPGVSVVGVDRDESVVAQALARGHITSGHSMDALEQLVPQAQLVVLATPIEAIIQLIPRIACWSRPGTLVIDLGSAKGSICRAAAEQAAFAEGVVGFIGGHPLAGSRHSGGAQADPTMLDGAPFVICPVGSISTQLRERAVAFLQALRFQPVQLDPHQHDQVVAVTSHVPHLLAALLANHVGNLEESRSAQDASYFQIAGGGLDRMTDKASGQPELWAEIIAANSTAVGVDLRRLARQLVEVAELVDSGGVLPFLTSARARRAGFERANYRHQNGPTGE